MRFEHAVGTQWRWRAPLEWDRQLRRGLVDVGAALAPMLRFVPVPRAAALLLVAAGWIELELRPRRRYAGTAGRTVDVEIDVAALVYGPKHISFIPSDSAVMPAGFEDASSCEARLDQVIDFARSTADQARNLDGRLEWEHNYCETDRVRFPNVKADKKHGRDWVFEEYLLRRFGRRGAADPATGCAGCPLSFIGRTPPDRSILDAFTNHELRNQLPDDDVRRADIDAHRYVPAAPPPTQPRKPKAAALPTQASRKQKPAKRSRRRARRGPGKARKNGTQV